VTVPRWRIGEAGSLAVHAVPFARFFSHLSHLAPGRGSSGVHGDRPAKDARLHCQ
jgi:hypothetical protein